MEMHRATAAAAAAAAAARVAGLAA